MLKIMTIDDDPHLLRLVARMLEQSGHECLAFDNVEAAMAVLDHVAVDAVLTDVFMPQMDGFDLLNLVRGKLPGLPVIAMSGGGRLLRVDMLPDTRAFGAAAVIDKPFTREQLLSVIAQVVPSPV